MPKISINMITKDRANYIGLAIDSILKQSFKDWELIIIDNDSQDNTEAIINNYINLEYPIKYFKIKEKGNIPKSRNIALNYSTGDYIAILDSDDLWLDEKKLEKQVDFLENNKDYLLVGGGVVVIDKNGKELKKYFNKSKDWEIRKALLLKNQFCNSSVLYSKKKAIEVGKYDESLNIGEDYDLFFRLGLLGKICNLDEYLVGYRVHDGSICVRDKMTALKCNLKIINKYKTKYPNYWLAYLKRKFRIIVYYFIMFKK
jgi:glycosyltransferase involved in cell wall biosynthesis